MVRHRMRGKSDLGQGAVAQHLDDFAGLREHRGQQTPQLLAKLMEPRVNPGFRQKVESCEGGSARNRVTTGGGRGPDIVGLIDAVFADAIEQVRPTGAPMGKPPPKALP